MSETRLEDMTKADLIEHAKALGISPANNDMTKAELIAAIEQHEDEEPGEDEPEVEGEATTTATKDYLGRQLITPSVNSKDYLGRPTQSAIDYLGRLLLL